MGLECGWRHARKRWSWEFEDFEKESVGSWDWTMEAENWALCYWVESWIGVVEDVVRVLQISTDRDLNITRCAAWLGSDSTGFAKTLKNCVSLLVSKNRSQKLIKPFVPNNRVRLFPPAFACFRLFSPVSACLLYLPVYSFVSALLWLIMIMAIQHEWKARQKENKNW